MDRKFHLAPYILIGTYLGSPGDQFLIDDKFEDGSRALCLLHHEASGSLLLCIIDAIVNVNGNTILILGTSDPEELLEHTFNTYYALKLVSPTVVELVEEKLSESIYDIVEESVELDRAENLARVESIFGTLREFQHGKETVPHFKENSV
jgi:hypothetical protein